MTTNQSNTFYFVVSEEFFDDVYMVANIVYVVNSDFWNKNKRLSRNWITQNYKEKLPAEFLTLYKEYEPGIFLAVETKKKIIDEEIEFLLAMDGPSKFELNESFTRYVFRE